MADVNQKLGFDASSAIKSLESLSFTIDTVNQRIRTLSSVAKGDPLSGLQAGARETQAAFRSLDVSIQNLRRQMVSTGVAGTRAGNDVTVSWQTMLRVVQTQIIVRTLSELQQQFFETAEAARAFELQIARITTIAGEGLGSSTEALSANIRALAIDLGRPLEEVSSAAFQTLQNDVGDVTESLEFLRNASKLSVVQGSELETAMNALTSVFKVYGAEVGNSADASDTLFVAVDKGRITLDELADRLGTIIAPAEQLGFAFDQTAAAAASLTQTGLNTATATTQLRNIILKLVKPTESLQGAIEGLGFSTANDLVASLDGKLLPVLQALRTQLGGTDEAVAKAFGTIRGSLGVFNLLTQEGKLFEEVLDAFDDKAGALSEAFGKVEQTNAREYAKELAKVNDVFLGLGETSSEVQTVLLGFFNSVIPNSQAASAALVGLGTAGLLAGTRIAAGSALARVALTGLLGPIGLVTAALGAVAAITFANLPNGAQAFQDATRDLSSALDQINKETTDSRNDATNELNKSLKDQRELYKDFFNDLRGLYAQDVSAFEDSAKRIVTTSERLIEGFTDSRESLLEGVDDFLNNIDERIIDGTSKVRDAARELDDFNFERSQAKLTEAQKAFNELARAQQTATQAQQAFNRAGVDPKALDAARELQDLAEKRARDAFRAAERTDNQNAIQQAASVVQRTLQQGVAGEQKAVKALQGANTLLLGEERDRLKVLLEQEAALANQVAALNSRRTPEGDVKTSQQIVEDSEKVLALGQKINKVQSEIQAIKLIDDAGLRNLEQQTAAAFERGISKVRFDFNNAVFQLESTIQSKNYQVGIEIANPEAVTSQIRQILASAQATAGPNVGNRLEANQKGLEGFVTSQVQAKENVKELSATIDVQIAALNRFNQAAAEGGTFLSSFQRGLSLITKSPSQSIQERLQPFADADPAIQTGNQIVALFEKLRTEGVTAAESVTASAQKIKENLSTQLQPNQVVSLTASLEALQKIVNLFQQQQAAIQLISPEAEAEARTLLADTALQFETISQKITAGKLAQDGLNVSVQTTASQLPQTLSLWQQITQTIQEAAAASARVKTPGGQSSFDYFGGNVFRATGGDLTRGQDQTLVAAQEGEFITNAKSSQRFFAELRAINAGQVPVFRDQGGPVTNIGDINVNVDARNSSAVDGRQIARQLDRELRRTSSNLRGN